MHTKSIAEIITGLASGEFSSTEITQHFLQRIQTLDKHLNSFVTVTEELALKAAENADNLRAKGQASLFTGVPFAHKDIFCTKGVRTSCASKMLDNFIAPYESTVTQKFLDAGAVMLGKTNMDEFAMGSSNESSFYGPTKNPWNTAYVPGGSSGGSAAAVAAGLIPGATGTDTGGSIRQPAAFCGITGIKPTYGRVSRWGMIAFASSLDQAGPMARSAEDCAYMLNLMSGFDSKDSTSIDTPTSNYTENLSQNLSGLKIGIPKEYLRDDLDPQMLQAFEETVKVFEKLGAKIQTISLPHTELAVPAYYVIAPAECSSNLSRMDGVRFGHRCESPVDLEDLYKRSRAEGFGDEVKRRILIGTYALSAGYYDAYYLQAQKVRRLIKDDFVAAYQDVDVILSPTCPTPAFKLGEKSNDPVTMYLEDIFTIATNLAGLPALSMPAGSINNLPVGVQLIGNYFAESQLLNAAYQYQQVTNWHQQRPDDQNIINGHK